MKTGFVKSGLLQGAFPYVTAVFAISLLLFGSYLVQILYEKGIEIVRSRGYQLEGDHSLGEFTIEGAEAVETEFRTFMQICERVKRDGEILTVYSDVDARSLFLFDPGESGSIKIYFCRFS
jgi:hypothetical protein